MKNNTQLFLFIMSSIVFVILSNYFNISMFDNNDSDGFKAQIFYVSKIFNGELDYDPLFFVHLVRLIIITPFYINNILGLPNYIESLGFILYLIPFFKKKYLHIVGYLPCLFVFLPLFVSYRTALGMLSMTYLFILLFCHIKSYSLLFFSALLSNLSSGIVLSWIMVSLGSFFYLKKSYKYLLPLFLVISTGLIGSFINKFYFMFTTNGIKENGSMIERSNIYISIIDGNYFRLFFYISLCLSLLFCIFTSLLINNKNIKDRLFIFFLSGIPAMFSEGLGLISYLMCFLIFYKIFFKINMKSCHTYHLKTSKSNKIN